MTRINITNERLISNLLEIIFTALLVFVFAAFVVGQSPQQTSQNLESAKSAKETVEKKVLQPVFTSYKGISIGSTADEVKDKLGKPKIADNDGFYYIFSDKESAQIGLDGEKKVSVISITFSDKNEKAPTYENVFGKDIQVVSKPDGSIYNLIRYPEAGVWIAYSSTVGDNPTITVTLQKI